MKKETMRIEKIVLVCLMAILLSFLYSTEVRAQKTFTIGGFWPMTGPQAYYGRVMSRGAMTAIDQLNAAGGVEGYKLKLEITDYKNVDVNLAVTGVQKMIRIDKVPAVLASFSAPTLACQPICERAKVVMINGGAYSPKLVNKPYLHTIRMAQQQMVPPVLKYFWKIGIRRLAAIYISDPAGEVPAQEVVKPTWTKWGGTIVAMEPHEPGMTDYSAQLARIKANNPDAIIDISTGQDQAYIVKGAREIGLTCPISVPDWTADFQTIAGKTSENVFVCVEHFDRESTNPATQRFVKDFEARYEPSDFYSANYYDAVYNIIAELVRRVVAKHGNPLDGAQLESAIWDNPSFDTVYGGKTILNRDGTVTKQMVLFKIVNGKLTFVEKAEQ
jgi:branched-chain amino acid transport system substrate-binding protein